MPTSADPLVTRETGLVDSVAEDLMSLLIDGTWPPGTRVPPERALTIQYGVSRSVIREAVRMLVSKGLLETRGGSGIYVRRPDQGMLAQSVSLLLRLHHHGLPIPYQEVHEVRCVLEVEIAGLAARRATPQDIAALEWEVARLRLAHEQMDIEGVVSSDVAFHAALVAATHNHLFVILFNSISDVMIEIRQRGVRVPGSGDNAIFHHSRLLETVKAHDPTAAVRAMKDHLRDSQRFLRRGLEMQAANEGVAQRTADGAEALA